MFCYNIEDINKEEKIESYIMFKTHIFVKNEENNLYKIEFWNHNYPLHLEKLNDNYRVILFCPQAKNFYYLENTNEISRADDYFWYRNNHDLYGSIVFMCGRWGHAFLNLNLNNLSDLNI